MTTGVRSLAWLFTLAPPLMAVLLLDRPTSAQEPASPMCLITALDEQIQQRFEDQAKGFGLRRIIYPGNYHETTTWRFSPEDRSELMAVRGLERVGLKVVLYLAGRRVLAGPPANDLASPWARVSSIAGPVLITHADVRSPSTPDTPAATDLWDRSRRALEAFSRADVVTFAERGWNFVARPVRATGQRCLECHQSDPLPSLAASSTPPRSLQVGDALGVVLYGYQPGESTSR